MCHNKRTWYLIKGFIPNMHNCNMCRLLLLIHVVFYCSLRLAPRCLAPTLVFMYAYTLQCLLYMWISFPQSMDSQFSVTAVLFHGDHKIASAGTGDGYVQHVSVCTCLETLKWKILQVVLMHCRDKVHYFMSAIPCTLLTVRLHSWALQMYMYT